MRKSHPDFLAGRRLLQVLLPRAKARLTEKHSWVPMSALGRAQSPYLRIDNVEAVMIYQAPRGGWHGDVVLRSVPPGVPDTLGSPVEKPCPTREMAVELVTMLLTQIMAADEVKDAGPPAFLFHGFEVTLIPELVALAPAYDSAAHALTRLAEIERETFPDGIPKEIAITEDTARLLSVIYMAVKTGVFRYPPKPDTEPGDGPFMTVH